jgi:MFS family permease
MKQKIISKTVWFLCFVSLFTDIASELLYPVMPIYLKSIGFSALLIGLLEGVAEATAGLSKGYFGNYSDRIGKRVPFVRFGYTLSAISKPLLAFWVFPLWVFFSRTLDRLGKGIRTSARDAILSSESTPETKGRIFGLHRALDTFGAVVGPVLALIYLSFYPDHFKEMFLVAFIPGIISILLTLFLKDKDKIEKPSIVKGGFLSFLSYWKVSSIDYKKSVSGFLAFALMNSSDAFLLLMIKSIGFSNQEVIIAYIFYNLVYALFSYPVGILSDKIGFRNTFIIGLVIFALVYSGMSVNPGIYFIYALFFFYGIYASANESISKAWISNIVPSKDTATAIGFFSGFNSIFTMFASILAGLLWSAFSPSVTFAVSAIGTVCVAMYFLFAVKKPLTMGK